MARIFLSYAREDAAKAKSLAAALERAGHKVWWDRHLGGGSRFAAEIARELSGADAVIVLWSKASISSSWVQDEAEEGRDKGNLIPIVIDDNRPPLGFRQLQAIDLSRWSGRGRVPNQAAIESAIATVLAGGTLAATGVAGKRRAPLLSTWRPRTAAALVALLLIAIAGLYGTGRIGGTAQQASLAVMPFADFSPKRDKAYFAEGVAEEIRGLLTQAPGVQVIGRNSTELLGTADFRQARERLRVTHLLEGSVRVDDEKLRLNVRLIRASDGMQVWADEFDGKLTDVFAVQDQVGAAVAQKLRGTLMRAPLGRKSTRTAVQAFDLVLAAEAKWGEGNPEANLEAERLLKRATEIDPDYAPAWTARSRAMFILSAGAGGRREGAWGPNWRRDRELMVQYAKRAVQSDPKDADAQAWLGIAEGNKDNPQAALAHIGKALRLNSGDPRVWDSASMIYNQLCDHKRRLEALRRIAVMEPLDQGSQLELMWELYAWGLIDEADALKRKLSEKPQLAEGIASGFAEQQGDFTPFLAERLKANPGQPKVRVAHTLASISLIEPAIALLPSDYRKSVGAYWQGNYQLAADASDWLREGYWDTSRGYHLTRALVRSGRQRDLLRLFDQRFDSVEQFDRSVRCYLPAVAAPVVTALRADGRNAEADRLFQLADRRFRQGQAQRHYDMDIHPGYIELLLVAGRRGAALVELERAARTPGLRGLAPPIVRLELGDPVYDPIRREPRFKEVERRVAAWQAKERRDLAAAGFTF